MRGMFMRSGDRTFVYWHRCEAACAVGRLERGECGAEILLGARAVCERRSGRGGLKRYGRLVGVHCCDGTGGLVGGLVGGGGGG